MSLTPGTRLGPYEVTAPIGVGGMGEVYRALDTNLERQVAIKILPDTFAHDPERLARFEREAKTLASLNHPNIAQIYGLEKADGIRALVMELVEGPTLAERIAQGPIPLDDALQIARQIAEALEAAHDQGIIHRDLKPANIKLRPDGVVKVLDFGLAKALAPMSGGVETTASPTIMSPTLITGVAVLLGTAAYMSPEQAKGRPADTRSDIWAFGCVIYEMLAGMRAFEGEDISDTIANVLKSHPDLTRLPASTPPLVRLMIERCLEKDRARRLGDISAVQFIIADQTLAASLHHSASTGPAPRLKKRRWVALIAAVTVSGALGAAVVWMLRPSPAPATVARFSFTLPEGQAFTEPFFPSVAISRDGSQIAYVANKRVYVRSIGDLAARPIAGTETQTNIGYVVFAPDSQSIVFWVRTGPGNTTGVNVNGEIRRIGIGGAAPFTVARLDHVPHGIHWNDESLVFGQAGVGILKVSTNGGQPELLVRVKDDEEPLSPQILPGGNAVLFTVKSSLGSVAAQEGWDDAEIVAQSLSTGERKSLARGSDAQYLRGGYLLFARRGVMFALRFDAGRLEISGAPIPVLEGVMRTQVATSRSLFATGGAHASVSEGGTMVYVPGPISGVSEQRELVLIDRTGTTKSLSLPVGSYVEPRVSPDGTQVALTTMADGQANVAIYDLSGAGALRRLTLEGNNHFPIWSPDGQRIAFQSDREGDQGIYWQRADGANVAERLTRASDGASHVPAAWSRDGRVLFVENRDDTDTLWVFSWSDGKSTRFSTVQSRPLPMSVALSPDGRWIAYTSSNELFVQPFPATGAVYPVAAPSSFPRWSANGRELLHQVQGQIYSIGVTTQPGIRFARPVPLAAEVNAVLALTAASYDVLPDGSFVAAATTAGIDSGNRQIRIVLNWSEELKRLVPGN